MMISKTSVYALAVSAAVALLAGCGASQPPISVPGAMAQNRAVAGNSDRAGSWMLPEAKPRDLLYIAVGYLPDRGVYVYSYPRLELLGLLGGASVPVGACVDAAGHVFIVDQYNQDVLEYNNGGTSPIAAIYSPRLIPQSCSVDPTSGKLAVSGLGPKIKGVNTAVYVFAHNPRRGWRFPRLYGLAPMTAGDFCGYDGNGDLFVDGVASSGSFELAELPRGGNTLTRVTLDQTIDAPGQVQWDGTYLAIGDARVSPSVIYRFSISGSSGTEVGAATLNGSAALASFWIEGSKVIGLDGAKRGVGLWPYPDGGGLNRSLNLYGPSGVTVSPAR